MFEVLSYTGLLGRIVTFAKEVMLMPGIVCLLATSFRKLVTDFDYIFRKYRQWDHDLTE